MIVHDIYNRYPQMQPYRGAQYGKGDFPKLLLIGESHYLPIKPVPSKQHLTVDSWYKGQASTLTEVEKRYTNITDIITRAKAREFSDKEKSIFRNAFQVINTYGPNLKKFCDVSDYVVFYNFFLRPAKYGKSLKVKEQDCIHANDVFKLVYQKYQPDAVVFLSRLAGKKHFQLREMVAVPLVVTPHPSCAWWYRRPKPKNGKEQKNGKELLGDFVQKVFEKK